MMPPIRLASQTDLPRIVDIYNQAIQHQATADLAPLTVEDRMEWFNEHDPKNYPIYVYEQDEDVTGWCSISPYRKGRMALRHTAEISYYVDYKHHDMGIGSALIQHAIDDCPRINIKALFAIILEWNKDSISLLEKFGFKQWGFLPDIADFDGKKCGHVYMGLQL